METKDQILSETWFYHHSKKMAKKIECESLYIDIVLDFQFKLNKQKSYPEACGAPLIVTNYLS